MAWPIPSVTDDRNSHQDSWTQVDPSLSGQGLWSLRDLHISAGGEGREAVTDTLQEWAGAVASASTSEEALSAYPQTICWNSLYGYPSSRISTHWGANTCWII